VQSSKYDTDIDLSNENTSHTQIVTLVGANRRVLDVGCASGYLAQVLTARGCTVSGVEYDAAAAELAQEQLDDLVVGNVEELDLVAHFGRASFDAVIFGDVLEHLRRPLDVLRAARPLLAPGGFVVASIPNIAHGAVRLALLQGHFDYRPLGLLDDTHIRFFTRESVETLFRDAGLVPVQIVRTTAGLFETEFGGSPADHPPELIAQLLADPEATTYQFVVKAILDDADAAVLALHEREEAARVEIVGLRRGLEHAQGAMSELELDAAKLRQQLGVDSARAAELRAELDWVGAERDRLEAELTAVMSTRTMRALRWPRAGYARLRDRRDAARARSADLEP
jgi:2-polyprenyl-3-methyl-5-hydroxy-6-metoxy-1,4-benzoquinol methylase